MTKEDGNLRTYDSEGYKLRAGCVCVKDERQKEVSYGCLLGAKRINVCPYSRPRVPILGLGKQNIRFL